MRFPDEASGVGCRALSFRFAEAPRFELDEIHPDQTCLLGAVADPLGCGEYRVGLFKFIQHLMAAMPVWLSYST